ncbi:MAG: hypothetical protein ABJG15_05240 [Hyphomonadaceae bacterium]
MSDRELLDRLLRQNQILESVLDELRIMTGSHQFQDPASFKSERKAKLDEEYGYFAKCQENHVRISRTFREDPSVRYMTAKLYTHQHLEVTDMDPTKIGDICNIRRSPGGHVEVKALSVTDEDGVESLIFQRWDTRGRSAKKQSFSFNMEEAETLFKFLASAMYSRISSNEGSRETVDLLYKILMDQMADQDQE